MAIVRGVPSFRIFTVVLERSKRLLTVSADAKYDEQSRHAVKISRIVYTLWSNSLVFHLSFLI